MPAMRRLHPSLPCSACRPGFAGMTEKIEKIDAKEPSLGSPIIDVAGTCECRFRHRSSLHRVNVRA